MCVAPVYYYLASGTLGGLSAGGFFPNIASQLSLNWSLGISTGLGLLPLLNVSLLVVLYVGE